MCTLLGICLSTVAFAQWSGSGSIYYNGGNVGIGTSSPLTELQVNGTLFVNKANSTVYQGYNKWFTISDRFGYSHLTWFAYYDGVDWRSSHAAIRPSAITANNSGVSFFTSNTVSGEGDVLTDFTEKMRFTPQGQLGIGTINPQGTLHVLGSTQLENTSGIPMSLFAHGTSAGQEVMLQLLNAPGSSGSTAFNVGAIFGKTNGSNSQSSYFSLKPIDTSGTGWSDGLTIRAGGGVGIGTTSPTEKLEVNGTIRSKKIKVEASPWPDYVFSDEYELRGLEELESFIQKNGHLPEVPSEQEVKKTGQDLGQVQAVLLKKIEELTLYLIEEQKQRKQLEEELKKLKEEISNKN